VVGVEAAVEVREVVEVPEDLAAEVVESAQALA